MNQKIKVFFAIKELFSSTWILEEDLDGKLSLDTFRVGERLVLWIPRIGLDHFW
jgi:hypothetical protein